jgi:hypothetical protein
VRPERRRLRLKQLLAVSTTGAGARRRESRSVGGTVVAFVCIAVMTLWVTRAECGASSYSPYERDTISRALEQVGGRLEKAPEGKVIEAIEVVALDVLDARDVLPTWVNRLHVTTRDHIVRREMLIGVGDTYDQARVEESARLLRKRPQLSLVLVIPIAGRTEQTVRLLVITKDVWSLRLNWNVEAYNTTLTKLVLQPAEINLLGTHTLIGALVTLEPDVVTVGGFFEDPNISVDHLRGLVFANAVVNRKTGQTEGSFGLLRYGQPLYSLRQRWGWWLAVDWQTDVERVFQGLDQRLFDGRPPAERQEICLPQMSGCLPYEYDRERWRTSYEVSRSTGTAVKVIYSAGVEADRRKYSAARLSGNDPAAVRAFEQQAVPISDTRLGPVGQLRSFRARYVRLLNYNTLGLQEDVQVGHDLLLRMYPGLRAAGSSRDLLGCRAAAAYTVPLGDGLARAVAGSTIQYSAPQKSDALLSGSIRVATPEFGPGRLIYDFVLAYRYRDYLNEQFLLGGNTRLRGYLSDEFIGKDLVAQNLELRSRPLQVITLQVGGALFYDVGDAFDGFENLHLKHSVGAGLRLLFPQFDRTVFRIDWGFPLEPPSPDAATPQRSFSTLPGALFFTFGQAFSSSSATGASSLPTSASLFN